MQDKTMSRITFLVSSFRAGGGERVMVDLANSFAGRGYSVDLAVLKLVGQYAAQVDPRVRVVSLDAGRIIFSLPKLVVYLRRERPETLLALDEYTHLLAIIAKRISGVQTKIVLRIGNILSELFKRYEGCKNKFVLPFFVKTLYKRADGIIANSLGVRDDVIKVTKIKDVRISVVYNPKDISFIRTRAKEGVPHPWLADKTIPVIVAVGRLRVQKNFPLLLRAFARIPQKMPARLIIVGTGREEQRLRTLICELSLNDSVALVGYADNPHAYMGNADMFISASLWEGLPNAVIEALVCGLSIISSDCDSGPREILAPDTDYRKRLTKGDGVEYSKYGALFAVDDEDALVEAMTKMLGDASLRAKYSALSKERAEAFDSEHIVDEYARALGLHS